MKSTEHAGHHQHHSYRALAFELIIDFAIMYLVMYTMIDTISHFHFNLNTLYMTLMIYCGAEATGGPATTSERESSLPFYPPAVISSGQTRSFKTEFNCAQT